MKKSILSVLILSLMTFAACNQPVGSYAAEPDASTIVAPDVRSLDVVLPPICGNGVKEEGEECDGDTFVTRNYCEDYGFTTGQVSCTDACLIDTSGCTDCGDGVAEGGELCDLDDLHDPSGYVVTCQDRGYDDGNLMCNTSCNGYDESGCVTQ